MNAVEMPLATVWQQLSQIVITNEGVRNLFSQFRTCGDEENRTLNPRLANSAHCVRRCAPWPLTCADSPGKTVGVRAGRSARQHHWQHSIRRPPTPTVLARSFRVGHRTVAS